MNRNKNIIFRATKRGIVAGAAALMLAGTPVASAVMPVTTAYAYDANNPDVLTPDIYYTGKYKVGQARIDGPDSALESIEDYITYINNSDTAPYSGVLLNSHDDLIKFSESFKNSDTLLATKRGGFEAYAKIYDGDERIIPWGVDYDASYSAVIGRNSYDYSGYVSHSQYGDFYSTMSMRKPYTDSDGFVNGEGLTEFAEGVYEYVHYAATCFENNTMFGIEATDTDAIKSKIEELKKTGATFTGTNYEKAKTAFDWTIKNTDYNKLGDSKTFASTFYWLCEGAGVDSMMYISDDESRVFNVITLDGQNYLVDTYAAVEASDPSAYFNFIPTASDSLHAVKVSLASKAYDPNAKKDTPSDDSNKNNNSGSNSSDNSGNTSDDSDNSSSDDAGSDDSGSTGGGANSDDSSDSNTNDSSSSSTYTTGRYQRTAGDASYTAVANVPVTIANADTGIYAYNDAIKEAVQSVLPGYTVQNYINIATPAPSGNIQILTPIECLMQNPGLVTGDVTAVKNYYLVYVNNGIIQLLPNTSNSPYMISAPIFGGGNYAIVMAD